MNIHIVMHESFEAPGAIADWAQSKNHSIAYTRLYEGDALPTDASSFDFLVVMGGLQSPATTTEECPHFDARKEIAFIKQSIEDSKIVLGVCLGAQMIGEAMGAAFEHSPNREIGLLEIELTHDAKTDPIFSSFPDKFSVGHWHGDMPGLTSDGKVLAKSAGCPRQIVRYAPKVYGFQCHFEFTPEVVEALIANSSDELADNASLPYVQDTEQLRSNDYVPGNQLLFRFLDQVTN